MLFDFIGIVFFCGSLSRLSRCYWLAFFFLDIVFANSGWGAFGAVSTDIDLLVQFAQCDTMNSPSEMG